MELDIQRMKKMFLAAIVLATGMWPGIANSYETFAYGSVYTPGYSAIEINTESSPNQMATSGPAYIRTTGTPAAWAYGDGDLRDPLSPDTFVTASVHLFYKSHISGPDSQRVPLNFRGTLEVSAPFPIDYGPYAFPSTVATAAVRFNTLDDALSANFSATCQINPASVYGGTGCVGIDWWGWSEYGVGFTGNLGCNTYVGSSRVDLQACKLEYSIVSPK